MGVQITGEYLAGLKTEMTHGPSGVTMRTAAPLDNNGDGSSFSPTDLVAAALGSCMITTMAIVAEREGIPFPGARFAVQKHMRSDPRRVARLPVRIEMPDSLPPQARARLEAVARSCPVALSLAREVEQEVEFLYTG
jgi:putative redox protein